MSFSFPATVLASSIPNSVREKQTITALLRDETPFELYVKGVNPFVTDIEGTVGIGGLTQHVKLTRTSRSSDWIMNTKITPTRADPAQQVLYPSS